jgi:hypothetical protein
MGKRIGSGLADKNRDVEADGTASTTKDKVHKGFIYTFVFLRVLGVLGG